MKLLSTERKGGRKENNREKARGNGEEMEKVLANAGGTAMILEKQFGWTVESVGLACSLSFLAVIPFKILHGYLLAHAAVAPVTVGLPILSYKHIFSLPVWPLLGKRRVLKVDVCISYLLAFC